MNANPVPQPMKTAERDDRISEESINKLMETLEEISSNKTPLDRDLDHIKEFIRKAHRRHVSDENIAETVRKAFPGHSRLSDVKDQAIRRYRKKNKIVRRHSDATPDNAKVEPETSLGSAAT